MIKLVILTAFLVVMAGIFHMMFIMWDYGFHNPDSGFVPMLSDAANRTMDLETQSQVDQQANMLRDGFGICRFICIGLIPVAFVVGVLRKPKEEE